MPECRACHAGAVIVECVVNVSEGRDEAVLAQLAAAAGPTLLDLHRDPDHHRSVFTLAGPADDVADGARSLAGATVARLDLREHAGAHPRLGVLDVVPFVPYEPGGLPPEDLTAAVVLRDEFARWLGTELGVPSFLYGPLPGGRARTLPDVRRHAFGPAGAGGPQPRLRAAGARPPHRRHRRRRPAACSSPTTSGSPRPRWPGGSRRWCAAPRCAPSAWPSVSGPRCRATWSTPSATGRVCSTTRWRPSSTQAGGAVQGAELVGLLPEVVLTAVPPSRWAELGLSEEATVESRLPGRHGPRSGESR